MAGTREGGLKAKATNKGLYGKDWYSRIGQIGGRNGHTGGFASHVVGKDGLTGVERAKVAGAKGGAKSKRGKAKPKNWKQSKTYYYEPEMVAFSRAEERRRLRASIRAMQEEEDWND